jgi:preprotein translocase subunit YajC
VTSGGIVGKVAKVKDDGELLVEIADNVQVRVIKGTLSDVRAKGEAKSES